ncbi:hypothetical protein AK812_SmicGene49152 [Symbiodinium microadriaticum]|uniref:4Fe-4S ferredoxin-type domain-containing protein n=1 Tax=Symbiodinium microadriaticum TaxID=2951 RepID=A0A1Q9DD69_SYMMI|nr:hypothetical protein AK812_SmicGene49152 [Symbiodinium microadriaticum]
MVERCSQALSLLLVLAFIPSVAGQSVDEILLPAVVGIGGLIVGLLLVFGSVACARRCCRPRRHDQKHQDQDAGCVACGGTGCGLCTSPCMACDNKGCSLCTSSFRALEEAVGEYDPAGDPKQHQDGIAAAVTAAVIGDAGDAEDSKPTDAATAWDMPSHEGDVEQSHASPLCILLEPKGSAAP